MTRDLIPAPFFRFPSMWDEAEEIVHNSRNSSGLSISEDEKYVYIEASLPGIDPKDVDITFDKGVLWIKGEAKEEISKKKYYRKALSTFSYQCAVPGDVNLKVEPVATSKNGIMIVKFAKSEESKPKKISVKA